MKEYMLLSNEAKEICKIEADSFESALKWFENFLIERTMNYDFYIIKIEQKYILIYLKNAYSGILNLGKIIPEKERIKAVHRLEFLRIAIKDIYFIKMKDYVFKNNEKHENSYEQYIQSLIDKNVYITYDLLYNGMNMYDCNAIREQAELYLYEFERIYNHMLNKALLLSDEKTFQKNINEYFDSYEETNILKIIRINHESGYDIGFFKKYNDRYVLMNNASIMRDKIHSIEEFNSSYQKELNDFKYIIQAKHYI